MITPLFTKLNLGSRREIFVVDPPAGFAAELGALEGVKVRQGTRAIRAAEAVDFVIAFVTTRARIAELASLLGPKVIGDAVVWFAYPKGTSKRYRADFNRDAGWEPLGLLGLEGVRQVAIDEDWSALRFRRVEHVTKLTRDPVRAGSAAGKARAVAAKGEGAKGAAAPTRASTASNAKPKAAPKAAVAVGTKAARAAKPRTTAKQASAVAKRAPSSSRTRK